MGSSGSELLFLFGWTVLRATIGYVTGALWTRVLCPRVERRTGALRTNSSIGAGPLGLGLCCRAYYAASQEQCQDTRANDAIHNSGSFFM